MIGQELTTTAGKVLTITGIEKRFKKDAEGNQQPNGINYVVNIEGIEKRLTSDKIKSLCGLEVISAGEGKKTLLDGTTESDIEALYNRLRFEFGTDCKKIAKRFQFSDAMIGEFMDNADKMLPTLEAFTERWHEVQKERAEKKAEREKEKAKERLTAKAQKLFDGMDAATRALMLEMLKAQQASK